jgi:hypothetical protein
MPPRRRAALRAEVRQLIQAVALDLESAAVRAFLERVDRLFRLGDRSIFKPESSYDIPCALAHVAPYGATVGAAAYVTGAGSDFDDLRRRIAEVAPHLGLEVGAGGTSPEGDAWLRRQLVNLDGAA